MKNCTREKVAGNCLLPRNWMTFLRCSENRAKLFPYLSNVVVTKIQDKGVVLTANENVVTNKAALELPSLMLCNLEEVDEMIFTYVKHTSIKHTQVNSDGVVIAITNFHQLVS